MKRLLFIALLAGQVSHSYAADWPQFLGPQRSGVADEKETVATGFPTSGAKILWSKPIGTGFAGASVADAKVVVFHRVEDQAIVEAMDAITGKSLWHYSYPDDYKDSFGFDNGPRISPTIAAGKVIVYGAEGKLSVLDFETGKLVWNCDTAKEFNSPQGFFGRVSAPLVVGENVILDIGGKNAKGPAGFVAFDLATGKVVWQGVDDEASYSAPILREADGFPAVIGWMRNQLIVSNAKTGKVTFQQKLRSGMDASVNAATPIWCSEDRLFTTACYDVGATLWKWDPAGKLKVIWKKDDVLDCHYSSPIYKDGYLYGFHGRQEFGQTLRCVRVEDGNVMWESGRLPGGTLLLVKGTLLVLTEAGELWMVDASPEKFHRHASEQILRAGHRSAGAFSNGIFYARDGRQLVAVDLR